jgi:hypothetical protein
MSDLPAAAVDGFLLSAIDRTPPTAAKPGRYRPTDSLLAFLEAL